MPISAARPSGQARAKRVRERPLPPRERASSRNPGPSTNASSKAANSTSSPTVTPKTNSAASTIATQAANTARPGVPPRLPVRAGAVETAAVCIPTPPAVCRAAAAALRA